jgi:hypothetical protein
MMAMSAWFSSATVGGVSAPAGWTVETTAAYTTAGDLLYVWSKQATSADVSAGSFAIQWTDSNTYYAGGEISAYSGGAGTNDFTTVRVDPVSQTVTQTTTPAISATTATANTMLVWIGMDDNQPSSNPTGLTGFTVATTADILTHAYKLQAAAGATGSIVGTYSSNSGYTAAVLLGFKNATAAPVPPASAPNNFTMAAVQRASSW